VVVIVVVVVVVATIGKLETVELLSLATWNDGSPVKKILIHTNILKYLNLINLLPGPYAVIT
jgi:hypothetical protein